ncbi:hypothetical protein DFP72DRAFT_1049592 [Ephemerocybe angulata]|uniref:Fe2OG dioxygenase domain-containing protein n=1 Tax=Ephemerocybe angulata TaxID=980116 RepID=A0A8H6HL34_9AGAR|nr:hypothetical protein DFP72DRAFT_1049592 [Tulosesus angulatus]
MIRLNPSYAGWVSGRKLLRFPFILRSLPGHHRRLFSGQKEAPKTTGDVDTGVSPPVDLDVVKALLHRVRESTEKLAGNRHCYGTYPLTKTIGGLAYRKTSTGPDAGWLDFTGRIPKQDLEDLVQACDPATFGRGNKDVLDPSYRRAWKLDTSRFASQFDIVKAGLLEVIHDELLRYGDSSLKIDAQLYKLNVYGPGSHFKSHLDTPRSDNMFGSLVVVLPTTHVGGDLVLRYKENTTWTFESSKLVGEVEGTQSTPRLAWAAFFSDIEHEVSVVESGYRVSLTYNLNYADDSSAPSLPASQPTAEEANLKEALRGLLASPDVLPDGGALGFGLTYKYPIPLTTEDIDFVPLARRLKGTDAVLKRICSDFNLECQVMGLYDYQDEECDVDPGAPYRVYLTPKALPIGAWDDEDIGSLLETLNDPKNFRVLDATRPLQPQIDVKSADYIEADPTTAIALLWATPSNDLVCVPTPIMAYGNQTEVDWRYANLVLVAIVPPYKDRLGHIAGNN